jgi:hypothetical protein
VTTGAHQPEIARLLELCTGSGKVVLIAPSDPEPHHFYAGITRPPVRSMLDAILLALGGRLPDGALRYEEIVVVSTGTQYDEQGRDCPIDEAVVLDGSGSEAVVRGDDWRTWWYRRPRAAQRPAPPAPGEINTRPRPLAAAAPPRERFGRFDVDVPGHSGINFPNRHQALKQIVDGLQARSHRTLLIVNLAALDYPTPDGIDDATAHDHARIHDVGIRDMRWLPRFIDGYEGLSASTLDVVLYSRNSSRIAAFRGEGLPRPPRTWLRLWPRTNYNGSNLHAVSFPCGPYPWGNVFSHDAGFREPDGGQRSSRHALAQYHLRTLPRLLRGRSTAGDVTRLRAGNVAPRPPVVTGPAQGLDRAYWAALDVPAVEAAFRRQYFAGGSITCEATIEPAPQRGLIDNLFDVMRMLQELASNNSREFTSQATFKQWRSASTILLSGTAGTGKSLFGKALCPLLFGHEAHVFRCAELGGGGGADPAAHMKFKLFGASHPYEGAGELTPTAVHLTQHHGFTVLIFDEIEKAISTDLQSAFSPLYNLLELRVYEPSNGQPATNLMNAVVILTSNLSAWPPESISGENHGGIERRVLPWRYGPLSQDQMRQCAEWFLVKHIQERLDQTAVCYCSRSVAAVERLSLLAKVPSAVESDLRGQGYVRQVEAVLSERKLTADTVTPLLDVAPLLEVALG